MTILPPIVDPSPSSAPRQADLDREAKARVTQLLLDMLVEQRARVAYLMDLMGIQDTEAFFEGVPMESMQPFLEKASITEIPPGLVGLFNKENHGSRRQ